MAFDSLPEPTHRLRSRLVISLIVVAISVTAFQDVASHYSGTTVVAATPVVPVPTHQANPEPGAIPPGPAATAPQGIDLTTIGTLNTGPAEECAGISDPVGEHGGPSPHTAGLPDAVGEHGGQSPHIC